MNLYNLYYNKMVKFIYALILYEIIVKNVKMMKFIIKNKNSLSLNVKVMKYLIQILKNVKK